MAKAFVSYAQPNCIARKKIGSISLENLVSNCKLPHSCKRIGHHKEPCGGDKYANLLGRRQIVFKSFVLVPLTMSRRFSGKNVLEKDRMENGVFGFDGLGKTAEDYAIATIFALAQVGDGAVLFVRIDGFTHPMRISMGPVEAMAILSATQQQKSQRPVTHETWGLTLDAVGWKVKRVVITRLEADMFYGQLVLAPLEDAMAFGASKERSVEIRPSDGIALALRTHAPFFVTKSIAKELDKEAIENVFPNKIKSDPFNQKLQALLYMSLVSFDGNETFEYLSAMQLDHSIF